MALTTKQELFVQEYMLDPTSAARAAVRAGYGNRSAEVTASRLLKNDKVQEAVENAKHRLRRKAEKKLDRILSFIDEKATSDIGDVVDFSNPSLPVKPNLPKLLIEIGALEVHVGEIQTLDISTEELGRNRQSACR